MLSGMRSPYFLAVRDVVNKVDPVGLLALGAPGDEYDAEVEELVRWQQPATPGAVAEVFLRWFGAGAGELTADQAERIAVGIETARRENGSV